MPVSKLVSVAATRRSIEAELRLGNVVDLSMLFADKGERGHLARLAREAEGPRRQDGAAGGLMIDEGDGTRRESPVFIPGKSYVDA